MVALALAGAVLVGVAAALGVRALLRVLPERVHGVREEAFRDALTHALGAGADGEGIFIHVPGGSLGLQWEAQHDGEGVPGIVLIHHAHSPHRARIVELAGERGFRAGPPTRKRKRETVEILFGRDVDAAWELTLAVLQHVYHVAAADTDYFVIRFPIAERRTASGETRWS